MLTAFKDRCALSGCHNDGAAQVDLESDGVESRLIGKTASATGQCEDRIFVTTDGSPSLLVQKLEDSPPCGTKMPIGVSLSAAEIECINDWVESVSNSGGP